MLRAANLREFEPKLTVIRDTVYHINLPIRFSTLSTLAYHRRLVNNPMPLVQRLALD